MRIVVLACLLLAGCGQSLDQRERAAALRAELTASEAAYANSDTGRADLGCRTKTQFAMAGHQSRSFLDLEGTAKANQMHASCMEYWRRTGQMP